jgi:hypothetical protein
VRSGGPSAWTFGTGFRGGACLESGYSSLSEVAKTCGFDHEVPESVDLSVRRCDEAAGQ